MDELRVNADFDCQVILHAADAQWQASPQPGVTRRMLDRVGGEVARATSVVRYAPDSQFPSHTHGGGEEILVLEGVFGDEHGLYRSGSYLRNPIGTHHAPFSERGCLLLVKLRQFVPADRRQCSLDTSRGEWQPALDAGVDTQLLHRFGSERVTLERWTAGAHVQRKVPARGEEVFVLSGAITIGDEDCTAGSWLRRPAGISAEWMCRAACMLYRKTGHLPPV